MSDNQACANTDRELYREHDQRPPWDRAGNEFAPASIHVTEGGSIGMNVGGHVVIMTLRDWHAAGRIYSEGKQANTPTPPDVESLRPTKFSSVEAENWTDETIFDGLRTLYGSASYDKIAKAIDRIRGLRSWAEDEQHKRHAAEEKLVAVRSELERVKAERDLWHSRCIGAVWLLPDATSVKELQDAAKEATSLRAHSQRMREALERSVVALPPHKHLCPNCGSHIAAFDRAADELRSLSLRIQELEKGLRTSIQHIDHMAAWISNKAAWISDNYTGVPYSFESLGEDMPDIRRLLGATKEAK